MISRTFSLGYLTGCFTVVLLSSCATSKTTVNLSSTVVAEPIVQPVVPMAMDSSAGVYRSLYRKEAVIAYYHLQDNKLIWFDSLGRISLGDSMLAIIRNVRYFGLLPQHFHLEEIEERLKFNDPQSVERTDALMTDAFFRLANDLKYGVDQHPGKEFDSVDAQLLRNIHHFGGLSSTLKSREPKFSPYVALKQALASILDTTETAVRERLLTGEVNDSVIFKTVQSIEINLERWRRERNFVENGRYIYINVPSFMLSVVADGKNVMASKVIVGAPKTSTPEISSEVECLVVYPYWHVPRKIAVEEYLPIIQKDTSFITRNNFDVLDRRGKVLNLDSIDWKKFNRNYFPVSLRQREGKGNSLGLIKFVFDNPYAVFLHDTNAKGLFRNTVRAYSHGCIRAEKAIELGHYLLTGAVTKRSTTLEKYLGEKQRRFVSLSHPVPIFVRYFTCEMADKTLYVYDDCYDMDKEVAQCLYESL